MRRKKDSGVGESWVGEHGKSLAGFEIGWRMVRAIYWWGEQDFLYRNLWLPDECP
jgi:hypothetical protein